MPSTPASTSSTMRFASLTVHGRTASPDAWARSTKASSTRTCSGEITSAPTAAAPSHTSSCEVPTRTLPVHGLSGTQVTLDSTSAERMTAGASRAESSSTAQSKEWMKHWRSRPAAWTLESTPSRRRRRVPDSPASNGLTLSSMVHHTSGARSRPWARTSSRVEIRASGDGRWSGKPSRVWLPTSTVRSWARVRSATRAPTRSGPVERHLSGSSTGSCHTTTRPSAVSRTSSSTPVTPAS